MGVIHKLRPEVKDFILAQKSNNPTLSCRKLTTLVLDNFKIELSKSSINMIIKEAGLSAPIGRTPKKKRHHIVMPRLPVLSEDASSKEADEAAKKAQEEQRAKEIEATRIREEEKARKAEEEQLAQEAKKKAEEEAQKEILQPEQAKAIAAFDVDRFPQIDNTGIILLKAADSIIGASQNIAAAIKSRLARVDGNFNTMVENLIYLPLLKGKIEQPILDKLAACLSEIENIKVMNLDILRTITLSLQEVRCIRVILSDGENLYIDGQMYSVWSSPHIPYDFVSPIHNLKKYINKYFNEGQPLVLFNAPGYDMPSPEFFSLLKAFEAQSSSINNMILYGNKFNELEVIPSPPNKKRSLIFGVWPWQFIECRKVKSIGQFRRLHLEAQNSDFYIADIEMALSHPRLGKQVTLNGCAVKANLNEKTRLVILSNIAPGDKSSEELAIAYLNHWPNLEEAFQDYSHKIELFTYAANSQRFFSAEKLNPQLDHVLSVEELLRNYLLALDAYVRWYLLPSGYADKELMLTKERFYDLGVQLTKNNENCLASFVLPPEYSFGKDLGYLYRRLNEKEIAFPDGIKLFFK